MTTPSELRTIAAEYNTIVHTWSGTPRANEAMKQALLFETLASLIERVTALTNLTESLQANAAIATAQALSAATKNAMIKPTLPDHYVPWEGEPITKTSDSPWEGDAQNSIMTE